MKLEALSTKIPANVMEEIPLIIEKFGIDGPLRLSHFLSPHIGLVFGFFIREYWHSIGLV